MNSVFFFSLVFILFNFFSPAASRNISCFVIPGWSEESDANTNVVHIISEGEKDTIHYVWSTYKLPSIIVARTNKDTTLSIDTTKLSNFSKDAIIFKNGQPIDSIGLTFNKLWEINYAKDTDTIKSTKSIEDLDMASFLWSKLNTTLSCTNHFASVVLRAESDEPLFAENRTFEIRFSVSAKQEISDEYPHLVFTGTSTLLKLVLNNLHLNKSKSRFGFELSVFSAFAKKCKDDHWQILTTKSINDEYSPGVFSDVELLAPCLIQDKQSSFVSWRPVAYTGKKPIVANSSDVNIVDDPTPRPQIVIFSIAELYFSEKSNPSVFNITFGTQGDGFYGATQYTEWSLMLGTGRMVEIPLSASVIIFATAGLGITLLVMLGGGIFILYKRCKASNDDELLLN